MRVNTKTTVITGLMLALLTSGVLGVQGCQAPSGPPKLPFVGEWVNRLDDLGFVALMPPAEDVRVGDLYVFDVDPRAATSSQQRRRAARRIAATSRWASLPVLEELEQEYGQRPAWPRTPDTFVPSHHDRESQQSWSEPQRAAGDSLFTFEQIPTRLRLVGTEAFTSVSFSSEAMEAVIPTEAATLVVGEIRPESLAITLRAGSAESYALSLNTVIRLLTEQIPDEGGTRYRVKQPYRDNLQFIANPALDRVWLHVITEVLYIRSVDVSIRSIGATPADDQVTAGELATMAQLAAATSAPSQTEAGAEQPPGAPATDAEQAADKAGAPPESPPAADADTPSGFRAYAATQLDPIYGAFLRAKAINDVLAEANADHSPGSLVRFLSVTDESVALRRIWPRGLAIGVRGLTLEVDPATGDVLKSGPLGMTSTLLLQSLR